MKFSMQNKHPLKSFLNFLERNALIATVASFALCGLAYLYQALELQKWAIPPGMVDSVNPRFFLLIITGLAYCFSCTYIQEYLRTRIERYVPGHLMYIFTIHKLKKVARLSPIKDDAELQADLATLINNGKASRKNITKAVLFIVIPSLSCFFPFYALFFTLVLNTSFTTTLISYAITFLIIILIEYFTCGLETLKRIWRSRKLIQRNKNNPKTYLEVCREFSDDELKRLKKKLQTPEATESINHAIVLIAAILLFIVNMLLVLYSTTKKYWIYTDADGKAYASVFEMGEKSILKRADIDNNNITVHLNDQLFLRTVDKHMNYVTFTNVTVNDS